MSATSMALPWCTLSVQLLVALGGGSAIDTAKAASIVLADSTKAGWPSMVKYAEWDAFTHIITDDQLPLSCARQLSSAADLIQVPV